MPRTMPRIAVLAAYENAIRWEWVSVNPMSRARKPTAPRPDPPGRRRSGRPRRRRSAGSRRGGAPNSAPPGGRGVGSMSVGQVHRQAHTAALLMRRSLRQPRTWRLWTAPRPSIGYLLVLEAATAAATVLEATRAPITTAAAVSIFLTLVGAGLVVAELTRRLAGRRRRSTDSPHVNLSSAWTLPAALLLPPVLAAATVVILYLHLWVRGWYRARGVPLYRLTFSTCTLILASYAAATTLRAFAPHALTALNNPRSLLALTAAVLTYSAVNSGLVAGAIGLYEGHLNPKRALGNLPDNTVEYATLGLGLSTTVFLTIQPLLVLAQIPALLALHRTVLLRQLEHAATTDHNTGLLNATTWTNQATTHLTHAADTNTTLGLLIVDLDHLTRINNTHGHHTGDRVLQHVATTLRESTRHTDLLARYTNDEFVILCPNTTTHDLLHIANRIHTRIHHIRLPLTTTDNPTITNLTITASIGAATYPDAGPTLNDLLRTADVALYAAKDNGRNQTQTATTHPNHTQP
jgi:diguanylate cyclase (GGDEF)-like protein